MGNDPHGERIDDESIKCLLAHLNGALEDDPDPLQPHKNGTTNKAGSGRPDSKGVYAISTTAPVADGERSAQGGRRTERPGFQPATPPHFPQTPKAPLCATSCYRGTMGIGAAAIIAIVTICSGLLLSLNAQIASDEKVEGAGSRQSLEIAAEDADMLRAPTARADNRRTALALLQEVKSTGRAPEPLFFRQQKLVRGTMIDVGLLAFVARQAYRSVTGSALISFAVQSPSKAQSPSIVTVAAGSNRPSAALPATRALTRLQPAAGPGGKMPLFLAQARSTDNRQVAKQHHLPQVVLKPEMSGRVGDTIPLSMSFEPYALLPGKSFVLISGVPKQIKVGGGVERAPGIWLVEVTDIPDAFLELCRAVPGQYEIVADLIGPDGSAISWAKSQLLVKKSDRKPRENAAPALSAVTALPSFQNSQKPVLRAPQPRLAARQELTLAPAPSPEIARRPAPTPAPLAVPAPQSAVTLLPAQRPVQSGQTGGNSVPTMPPSEALALIARGQKRMKMGDIALARLLFERAALGGSAQAAFALAETYDPNQIWKLGAIGLVGDAQKARRWYLQSQILDANMRVGDRLRQLPSN